MICEVEVIEEFLEDEAIFVSADSLRVPSSKFDSRLAICTFTAVTEVAWTESK